MAKVRKRGDSWQIDYFDPNGKRVRQSFKKKKDAEAELGKRVSLIAEKRYLDVKKDYNTTLGELLDKYTENYRNQVWFKTSKSYFLENFRQFFGKDTRLANIRYVDLETYQNHLKQKPTKQGKIRTDATVNREMTCLHHVFTKAVEWEMTERSPFDRGKTLLLKENNKRLRYLSKQEIDKLLAESPKHLKRIVKCAIHTGMRRGEILGLKWSQIRNGFIYLEKTKTNEARQIPINDDLAGLLRKIRREQGLTSEHVFTYRQGEHALKHGKWAMQAKNGSLFYRKCKESL
jgi:integrase